MTERQRTRLNGWATHPLLEFLTKASLTLLAPLIVLAVVALFSMSDQLTELRTLYGALDGRVMELSRDLDRVEDRQYRSRQRSTRGDEP